MSQHEIAERAGVSRQTLINIRGRGRGSDRPWMLDLQLALNGPQTIATPTFAPPTFARAFDVP